MSSENLYEAGYEDGIAHMTNEVDELKYQNEIMGNEISEFVDVIDGYRDTAIELNQTINKLNDQISLLVDGLHSLSCEKEEFIKLIEKLKLEIEIMKRKNRDVSIT